MTMLRAAIRGCVPHLRRDATSAVAPLQETIPQKVYRWADITGYVPFGNDGGGGLK